MLRAGARPIESLADLLTGKTDTRYRQSTHIRLGFVWEKTG